MRGCTPESRSHASKFEPFLAIDAVGLLVVSQPAFTMYQRVNAPHAEPNPGCGNFSDPLAFRAVISWCRLIT